MNLFQNWFGWPNGSVLTNLLASAIWVIPSVILGARKLAKMHRHILQLHEHHGIKSE